MIVGLLSGIDGSASYRLGLVAGTFATGVATAVLYTFGVSASVLIDRVVGNRPTLSVGVHCLVGAATGAPVATHWFDGGALRFGALAGLLAATVAVVVARSRPTGRWGLTLIVLNSPLGLVGLAWLAWNAL